MNPVHLIVCERTGRWAVALKRALGDELKLTETRSLPACTAELSHAAEQFGVTVHQIEGLDLKDDIDGAAALCAALDLVISAPTAAAATAGSVGAETWFVTAGRTWPQLGTAEYPWYARTKVFWPEKFGDWETLMPDVSDELEVWASGAERKPLY